MTTPRRPAAGRSPGGRRPPRTTTRNAAARPAAVRPAGAAVGGGSPAARSRRSPSALARALVLALVMGVVLLSAAIPLREFLSQRGEIAELEQATADATGRVAELEAERARLQDPAYVAAEARRRLHFVRPGETAYVLLEPTPAPDADDQPRGGATAPWYSQLWGSVQSADRPAPKPAP